jgi:hypothetical protein
LTIRWGIHKNHFMPRPLRIDYGDAFYHVIAGGERKETIFTRAADKDKFLTKIGRPMDYGATRRTARPRCQRSRRGWNRPDFCARASFFK